MSEATKRERRLALLAARKCPVCVEADLRPGFSACDPCRAVVAIRQHNKRHPERPKEVPDREPAFPDVDLWGVPETALDRAIREADADLADAG